MLGTILKYFFILISCYYYYPKLLNHKTNYINWSVSAFLSLILSGFFYFIRPIFPNLFIPLLFLALVASVLLIYKDSTGICFLTIGIAFCVTYGISIFWTSIIALIRVAMYNPPDIICMFLIGILQLLTAFLIFRIERLKKGMPFLKSKRTNIFGIIICFMSITMIYIQTGHDLPSFWSLIVILTLPLSGIAIILWWRKGITMLYRNKIKDKKIEELEKRIKELETDNNKLSAIIHKDNKLLPAMIATVHEALYKEHTNSEYYYSLLKELEVLSAERSQAISSYETPNKHLPDTGNLRLNSIVQHMQTKANKHSINFEFAINADINYMTTNLICDDLFATLLADIIENAIIATKKQTLRNISVNIESKADIYCIHVYDSGVPFAPEVISNFGKARTTTHADDGGSGIGLMTTYNIMKQTGASFCIEELHNNIQFTKRISIYFDNLCELRVIN